MASSPLPSTDNPMLGIAYRLAAVALLGAMFAFTKLAASEGVSVPESLFWRQLAGVPVTIAWLMWIGRLSDVRTSHPGRHALRMIIGITSMGCNFAAMILLPMAEATTISFAFPIFATILAAILLKEPTGRWRWGAVCVGFLGVLVVVRPGALHVDPMGMGFAIAGAVLTALVTIQIRQLARTEAVGAIVFWFSLSSLVPLGLLLPFFIAPHPPIAWAYLAGLSIAGALAQLCLTAALRHGAVAVVLTMDYTGLIWSILYGYWLFDQAPAAATWLGAPLIVGAGLVIAWREHRRRRLAAMAAPTG